MHVERALLLLNFMLYIFLCVERAMVLCNLVLYFLYVERALVFWNFMLYFLHVERVLLLCNFVFYVSACGMRSGIVDCFSGSICLNGNTFLKNPTSC